MPSSSAARRAAQGVLGSRRGVPLAASSVGPTVTEPALSRIEAENFRSLRNVGVDLGAVNVLVGPNGAGKSNLLDVIEFLGDSVREDLAPALRNRGGYDRVYFRGETSGSIRIRVYAHVTSYSSEAATDEYSLTFRRQRMKPHEIIARWETFKFKRYQGPGRRITINGSKVEITDTRADDTCLLYTSPSPRDS